jgi:hypothetical protein
VDEIDGFESSDNTENDHVGVFGQLNSEVRIEHIEDLQQDIDNFSHTLTQQLPPNNHFNPFVLDPCPLVLRTILQLKLVLVHSRNPTRNHPQGDVLGKGQSVRITKSKLNSLLMIKNHKNRELLSTIAAVFKESGIDLEVERAL